MEQRGKAGQLGLVLALVVWGLLPVPAAADWHVGAAAGATTGGRLDEERFTWSVAAGYWPIDQVAVEGRAAGVVQAFEVEGQPEVVRRSGITVQSIALLVAPFGHRGRMRPFASLGVGPIHTVLEPRVGRSLRETNVGVEASVGALGALGTALAWRVEGRHVRDTGDVIPGLPGTSFWAFTLGVTFISGR